MKEFIVTIDRTINQVRTITIKAENEEQARNAAMDIASKNEGWEGTEYDTNYKIGMEEGEPNDYIDQYGHPYDSEDENACWPAGGGLHKDCDFNADALYAYYTIKDKDKIFDYLTAKGFFLFDYDDDFEGWRKGNTEIIYECYDKGTHCWGYMHTELIIDVH